MTETMNPKKLLSMAAIAAATCSCMNGNFKSEFRTFCTFDYSDQSMYKDSIYFETPFSEGSQTLTFHNKLNSDNEFTGGFLLSLKKDSDFSKGHFESLYSVADTSKNKSNIANGFAVYYDNTSKSKMPEHSITFVYNATGTCTPTTVSVSNTNYVANLIINGTQGISKFNEGDWLKLTIIGYRDGVKTGSTEIALAEYAEKGLQVLKGWTKLDLTKVGSFQYLDFKIDSNRDDIPRYCCIDNFIADIVITD